MNIQKKKPAFANILNSTYPELFFENEGKILKTKFDDSGIVVLPNLLSPEALDTLQKEADRMKSGAYRSASSYNLYVLPEDKNFDSNSPRNRVFTTSKGCTPDDQIPEGSFLRTLYDSPLFRKFICNLQGAEALFPYADTLSSVNINYYDPADSLEWHFDNADFAITLLLKQCEKGGVYEYFPNIRYTADGKENYEGLSKALDGEIPPETARMDAGTLMIFRGNKSLHRVTPIEKGSRILVTLNYNLSPGISLSEKSRMTFFGRVQ